jgi:serine/threonine protein kinase
MGILREFRKEILLQMQLSHPNFVQLHGICLAPLAMVLELVSHGNLLTLIHNHTEHMEWRFIKVCAWHFIAMFFLFFFLFYCLFFSLFLFCLSSFSLIMQRVCTEMAKGMQFLHGKQIAHLDLKSPNVMLTTLDAAETGPLVKIADFGVSRVMHRPMVERVVENPLWYEIEKKSVHY